MFYCSVLFQKYKQIRLRSVPGEFVQMWNFLRSTYYYSYSYVFVVKMSSEYIYQIFIYSDIIMNTREAYRCSHFELKRYGTGVDFKSFRNYITWIGSELCNKLTTHNRRIMRSLIFDSFGLSILSRLSSYVYVYIHRNPKDSCTGTLSSINYCTI